MDIEIERIDRRAVLHLRGDMDVQDAFRVPEAVAALFEQTTPAPLREVALDMSEVSFIDSVGLGMLIRCDEEARRHDASLRLLRPSHNVRRLLSITAMTQILTIAD